MSRIPALRAREIVRAFERLGFQVTRQRGSHIRLRHPDGRFASVPDHGAREFCNAKFIGVYKIEV